MPQQVMERSLPAVSGRTDSAAVSSQVPQIMDFSSLEIPASPRERRLLRRRVERELSSIDEEKEYLWDPAQGREYEDNRTAVMRFKDTVINRLRAANPFRDFDKVGASRFNDGVNPWRIPDEIEGANLIILGTAATIAAPVVVWAITHSFALSIGAGLFASAGLFLGSWGLRTLFNLSAALLTIAASPLLYAAAVFEDRTGPGTFRAKAFLHDLEASGLDRGEQSDLRWKRSDMLEKIKLAGRRVLTKAKKQDEAAEAREEELRGRNLQENLRKRWLSGITPRK